jgi:DNA replication and repair protein RecF
MLIRSLKLSKFKNHPELELRFPERICVFTGRNGSGKTNLLDAVHYVGLLRSAFHREDAQSIQFGESYFRLEAGLEENAKAYRLVVFCEREQKKRVEWNGKPAERMSDHLGKFPLVLILPDEPFRMNESADWRRGLMDNVLSQGVEGYVAELARFKRLLNQRNALLRYFSEGRRYDSLLLDSMDHDLAAAASAVFHLRQEHLPDLNLRLKKEYRLLSSGREEAELVYESELDRIPAAELLQSRRQADLEAGRTTAGLQRDDFDYLLNGKQLRKFASQGQQKTYLLALKFAFCGFLSERLQKAPCLLLDDVFDKLDDERIAGLIRRICAEDVGQVFISDAREERSRKLLEGIACQVVAVEKISS